jgi:hypothetical protein
LYTKKTAQMASRTVASSLVRPSLRIIAYRPAGANSRNGARKNSPRAELNVIPYADSQVGGSRPNTPPGGMPKTE